MSEIIGQLQFRLDDSGVMVYCGEQFFRNVAKVQTAEDGNQREFVFVQGNDGELYYLCAADQNGKHRLSKLHVAGTVFSILQDDRGYLIVLVVLGMEVFIIRQSRLNPLMFEAPALLYQGKKSVVSVEVKPWNGKLYIALVLNDGDKHRVVCKSDQDVHWEDLGLFCEEGVIRWRLLDNEVVLELWNHQRRFFYPMLHKTIIRKTPSLKGVMVWDRQWCEAGGYYEALGFAQLPRHRFEGFCGFRDGKWHWISGLRDINMYVHGLYGDLYHVFLLDIHGIVHHVVINKLGQVRHEVLWDMGLVSSISLRIRGNVMYLFGVDANHGLVHRLTMLCPNRNWILEPLVFYLPRQYEIRFQQRDLVMVPMAPSANIRRKRQSLQLVRQMECSA